MLNSRDQRQTGPRAGWTGGKRERGKVNVVLYVAETPGTSNLPLIDVSRDMPKAKCILSKILIAIHRIVALIR